MHRSTFAIPLCLALGCGGGTEPGGPPPPPPPPTPPGPPASIAVSAGDGQQADPGTAVTTAPKVVVKDAGGRPVPNVAVTFAIDSGGGGITGATATTAADGTAQAGAWTLGSAEGRNILTATAGSLGTRFIATARYQTAALETGTLAGSGGTIAVAGPGPLSGLQLSVPSGAFPDGVTLTLGVASSIGLPHPEQARVASPLITIESSIASFAAEQVSIKVPVSMEEGEFPIVAVVDPTNGLIQILPTSDFDGTSVTARLSTFNPAPPLPTVPTAQLRSRTAAQVRANVRLHLVVLGSKLVLNALPYETGFQPGVDDWEFPRQMTTIGATSLGQVLTADFYFARKKATVGKPLWGLLSLAKEVPTSNKAGIQWTATITKGMDGVTQSLIREAVEERAADPAGYDALMIRYIVMAMYFSGRPQPLLIWDPATGKADAILAFGWNGLTRQLSHVNAGLPGVVRRTTWSGPTVAFEIPCNTCLIVSGFPSVDGALEKDWSEEVAPGNAYEDRFPVTSRTAFTEVTGGPAKSQEHYSDTLFLTRDTATVWTRMPTWPHQLTGGPAGSTKLQAMRVYVERSPDVWEEAQFGSSHHGFTLSVSDLKISNDDGGVDRRIAIETRAVQPPVNDIDATLWADFTIYRIIRFDPRLSGTVAPAGSPTVLTLGKRAGPDLPVDYRYRIDFDEQGGVTNHQTRPAKVEWTYETDADRAVKLDIIHPVSGDVVARDTFRLELLSISPNPIDGASDTDYTLTATYAKETPAGATWEWDLGDPRLGDERIVITGVNSIVARYPIDLGSPRRHHTITVKLMSGATTVATGHSDINIATIPKAWRFTSFSITLPTGSPRGRDNMEAVVVNRFEAEVARWEAIKASGDQELGLLYVENPTQSGGLAVPKGLYFIDGPSLAPSALADGIRIVEELASAPSPSEDGVQATFVVHPDPNFLPAVANPPLNKQYTEIGTTTAGMISGVTWLRHYILSHNSQTTQIPDDYFPTDMRLASVTFLGDRATGRLTYLVRQYTGARPPTHEERRWEVRIDFEATRIQ